MSKLIKDKDGIVRGAHLKTTNGSIERPVYDLELTCDCQTNTVLDQTAPEFRPLSSRPPKMPWLQPQLECMTLQHKSEHSIVLYHIHKNEHFFYIV